MPMCVCHAFAWRTSRGRLCARSVLPVFPATLPSSVFVGCRGHARGASGLRLLMSLSVRATDLRANAGPPTRPCDSWGPLRQLRPTARSDSVIMGGLLLRFTVTHPGAHTHTPTPKARSQVARSLGAVRPGRGRGHRPVREGGR